MNTHDIELPPLPEDLIASMMLASEVRSLMRRYGERCASAAIEPYANRIAELEAALVAGFQPVRIPITEFSSPDPQLEGERVLWPDGTIRGYPPPGVDTVTVLRRAGTGRSGSKVELAVFESVPPPADPSAATIAAIEADRNRRGDPGLLMVQEADTVPHNHPEYGPGIFLTEDAVISTDPQPAEPDTATIADYEEVLADHRRLVRELDVLLNGEEGAAKQASLCDIVAQVRREGIKTADPVKVPSDAEIDAVWRGLTGRQCIPGSTAHAFARALLARYGKPSP